MRAVFGQKLRSKSSGQASGKTQVKSSGLKSSGQSYMTKPSTYVTYHMEWLIPMKTDSAKIPYGTQAHPPLFGGFHLKGLQKETQHRLYVSGRFWEPHF